MPTAYEDYLRQWVQVCDTLMNFEEEEKADPKAEEDESLCAWYDAHGGKLNV